jgi:hypothetical protein
VTFCTLGVGPGQFAEVVLPGMIGLRNHSVVELLGKLNIVNGVPSITAQKFKTHSIWDHAKNVG